MMTLLRRESGIGHASEIRADYPTVRLGRRIADQKTLDMPSLVRQRQGQPLPHVGRCGPMRRAPRQKRVAAIDHSRRCRNAENAIAKIGTRSDRLEQMHVAERDCDFGQFKARNVAAPLVSARDARGRAQPPYVRTNLYQMPRALAGAVPSTIYWGAAEKQRRVERALKRARKTARTCISGQF